MHIIAAALALSGLAAAFPGAQECHTTKTCKAIYHTQTNTIPYEAVKTVTVTEYSPVTKTTSVPSAYTVTSYSKE